MTESFEKIVQFQPAYDRRDTDPAKNYGITDVRILFVLKGAKGATQFMMSTGWYLPPVAVELQDKGRASLMQPRGWDLGYHSPVPRYEDQLCISEECPYVEGGKCYYDGSGLAADPILDALLIGGSDAVWEALEKEYHELFD